MTWAEFLIRQHAYRRIQKNDWYKVREIAYSSLIGSHIDPKKLPKSKDKFIPLDDEKDNTLNPKQMMQILKATKQYQEAKQIK
jgi:hypothetical protein